MLRVIRDFLGTSSSFRDGDRLSVENIWEFTQLLHHRRYRAMSRFLGDSIGLPSFFTISIDPTGRLPVAALAVSFADSRINLHLNGHAYEECHLVMAHRMLILAPLLKASHVIGARGVVMLEIGDYPSAGGLSFCAADKDAILLPDTDFLSTRGYENFVDDIQSAPPWRQRSDLCFWRGSSTGLITDDWRSLPRIRLCAIASKRPDLFDVGVTNVVQFEPQDEIERELMELGYLKPATPATDFARYRYTIDIDGNSNAWSSLFRKLLTGSPVLKVASPHGFRQWYYDALEPMKNFVPVADDLTDLVEKADWLHNNPSRAEEIGQAGRALALSLTFDKEFAQAAQRISAACTSKLELGLRV